MITIAKSIKFRRFYGRKLITTVKRSLVELTAYEHGYVIISNLIDQTIIETLFGIFKRRGFNLELEETHLFDSEPLSRLFAQKCDRFSITN